MRVDEVKGVLRSPLEALDKEMPVSPDAKDLMIKLLNINPNHRADSGVHGSKHIREHACFDDFQFFRLYSATYKIPGFDSLGASKCVAIEECDENHFKKLQEYDGALFRNF